MHVLDFSVPPAAAGASDGVADRDWPTLLGLHIDDAGNVVAIGR